MIEIIIYLALGVAITLVVSWLIRRFRHWERRKYAPDRATKFTCADQHVVRSKGEMIIDNWLTEQGVNHVYEKTITVRGHSIKYDWYLPHENVYVEYWGFGGKSYMQRKREKILLYAAGHLHLISIEDSDLENIYVHLKRKFQDFVHLCAPETPPSRGFFCPKCGANLDGRFAAPPPKSER